MKLIKRLFGGKHKSQSQSASSSGGSMGVPIRPKQQPETKSAHRKRTGMNFKSWKPNRSAGYLLAAVLLIAGSVYGAIYLAGNATVQRVSVSGAMMTDAEAIILASQIESGIPADSVHALRVIEEVEKLPYIRSAEVHISTLGNLHIAVQERKPVGILVQGDAMMLIDAEGIKMQIPSHYVPDLPLIYGFNVNPAADTLNSDSFKKTAAFLTALKQREVAMLTLSEVGWHGEDGVIALSRENGVRLVFGEDEFTSRLKKWEEFYRQVVPQRGMAAFTRLDFRFRDQIVARES